MCRATPKSPTKACSRCTAENDENSNPNTIAKPLIRKLSLGNLLWAKGATKKNTRRSVSFSQEVSEGPDSSYELTTDTEEAMWYTPEELEDMEDRAVRVIDGEEKFEDGEDLRGLEFYADSERTFTTEERNLVMLEHLQSISSAGMNDSFNFETLGSCLNRDSIKMGDMQAAQDSAEAYVIYLETMEPEAVNPCFSQQ